MFPRRLFPYLNKRPFDLPPHHRIPRHLPWWVLPGARVAVQHLAPVEAAKVPA